MNDSLSYGSARIRPVTASMEQDAISRRRARAIMELILWLDPDMLTLKELVHELPSDRAEPDVEGDVKLAVDNLVGHGLMLCDGDLPMASEPARYFDWLTCFSYAGAYVSPETRDAARGREAQP